MSNWTERQRLILTIAVMVLLTGGLLALIFTDRSEIRSTEEEISSLEGRVQAAEVEIQRIPTREDKVLVYRAVEDRELEILPTRQEIANFHRDLSTFLARAGLSFQELPESEPLESGLAKGIYVTRNVLSGRGTAAALLKFLNMVENDARLVAVKGLRVRAGSRDDEASEAAPVHDVEVHLETYFYNSDTKAAERNKIPGEEARIQDPAIRATIAAFEPERPDTYVLRPASGRRDPLTDPRRPRPSEDPAEIAEAYQRQEALVVELEGRVDDMQEKVEQESALAVTGDLFRRDRLRREVDTDLGDLLARLAQVDQTKKVVIPALVVRLETLRGRVDQVRSRRPPVELRVTREVAERTLAEVESAFRSGAFGEVATLATQWTVFLEGKSVAPDAAAAVEAIAALRPRARTYAEFQAIPLKVSGTIVHPEDPTQSVAVVNGRPVHVGERVDEGAAVEVGEIRRDAVVFVYKGEAIRVDRGGGATKAPAGAPGARLEAVNASLAPTR